MSQPFGQYGQNQHNWMPNSVGQQSFVPQNVFVPQNPVAQDGRTETTKSGNAGFGPVDPFLTGVAGNIFKQQGQTYLQRSHAFMQSKIGFLSGGTMQYLFAVSPQYVAQKLLMLFFPFLKKWTYSRVPDQLSGTNKYQPARQDLNAPDLYIPITALWSYCLSVGFGLFTQKAFKPEVIYNTVSLSFGAWIFHALIIKVILWVLRIPNVSFMELFAYAGYSFVYGCMVLLGRLYIGSLAGHVLWVYCSIASSIFLVRTIKRIIFQEPHQYGNQNSLNYMLLGLAVFQFPFIAWLSRISA